MKPISILISIDMNLESDHFDLAPCKIGLYLPLSFMQQLCNFIKEVFLIKAP